LTGSQIRTILGHLEVAGGHCRELTDQAMRELRLGDPISLLIAYFNFCPLPVGLRITPAMASGVTDQIWRLSDQLVGSAA
jgi:hypothetical protein